MLLIPRSERGELRCELLVRHAVSHRRRAAFHACHGAHLDPTWTRTDRASPERDNLAPTRQLCSCATGGGAGDCQRLDRGGHGGTERNTEDCTTTSLSS